MKKLAAVLIGLGLVVGSVSPTLAQSNGGKHGKGKHRGGHKGGSRGTGGPTK